MEKFETIVLLDCDTIILQDPAPYFNSTALQARMAGYPTVSTKLFKKLFQKFGLNIPKENYKCSVSGDPTIWYCNTGVLIIPNHIFRNLFPVWRGCTIDLCDQRTLLKAVGNFCEQASLTLAFFKNPVPFSELPLKLNCPVPDDSPRVVEKIKTCDPVIIHYHNRIDRDGLIIANSNPFARQRIAAFNERWVKESPPNANTARPLFFNPSISQAPSQKMMRTTIIMPVFNAASTLPACLDALRREMSSNPGCELICIDNCSTDRSAEIVRSFSHATLLNEPKQGAYAARNRGVAAAQGDILVFTDPDCVAGLGWLLAALQAFDDPLCLIALGVRRPAPDTGLNRLLGDYEIAKDRWVLSSNQPRKYYGYTNNMAVRRTAWEKHGPFEDRPRGGDTIFVRRLVDADGCEVVKFCPEMRVSHLEIDGSMTYLKKTFTYGKSLQSYSQAVPSIPLSFVDRCTVFINATRENSYGIVRSCVLAGLLLFGILAWWSGRISGRLQKVIGI